MFFGYFFLNAYSLTKLLFGSSPNVSEIVSFQCKIGQVRQIFRIDRYQTHSPLNIRLRASNRVNQNLIWLDSLNLG